MLRNVSALVAVSFCLKELTRMFLDKRPKYRAAPKLGPNSGLVGARSPCSQVAENGKIVPG